MSCRVNILSSTLRLVPFPRCSCRPCLPDFSLPSLFLVPVFLFSSPSDCCPFVLQVEQLPFKLLHLTQQDRHIAPRRLQPHKARAAQVLSLSWKYCGVTRAIVLLGFDALPTPMRSTTHPLHGHSIRIEDNMFLVTTPRGLSLAIHCSFVSFILLP